MGLNSKFLILNYWKRLIIGVVLGLFIGAEVILYGYNLLNPGVLIPLLLLSIILGSLNWGLSLISWFHTMNWVYPTSTFQQRDFQKEYEEALKKQKEWSAQKQAENQKWFGEQTAKNEAQSKAWFDQKVAESQKSLEQWKKDNGF